MKYRVCWIALLMLGMILMSACETDQPPVPEETTANRLPTAETTELAPAPSDSVEPEASEPALDGSFSTPEYDVRVVDGVCYLNFKNGNETDAEGGDRGEDNLSIMNAAFIRFSSLADMKQVLVNGELTAEQTKIIQTKFSLTENGYAICNVHDLICPSVPAGLVMDSVYLYGEKYEFLLRDSSESSMLSAAMFFGKANKWDQKYAQWMETIEKNTVDRHETGEIEGIPCETYIVTTKTAQTKYVFLTLPAEENETSKRIMMRYVLRAELNPEDVSDTVPDSVYIFGERDGIPYDYYIYDFIEAPTVEWLSSFSIAPYEDVPPAAAS
jgi:hypothetical protein